MIHRSFDGTLVAEAARVQGALRERRRSGYGRTDADLTTGLGAYDRWLKDPRVEFYPEPRGLDAPFRQATDAFAAQPATKWVGDCYLLAYSKESEASPVTFDTGLLKFARKHGCAAILPA